MSAQYINYDIKQINTYHLREVELLRKLAYQLSSIATSERNIANRKRWKNVNDRISERPVAMCNTLPWNELNVNDELTLQCDNKFMQNIEQDMRRQIYLHQHMPLDIVIEPYFKCKAIIEENGYGIEIDEYTIKTDTTSAVSAHQYNSVINSIEDIEKLRPTIVTFDEKATLEVLDITKYIFDGIMDVKLECIPEHIKPHAPWDYLVQLMGAENLFINLYDQPDLMLMLAKRYSEVTLDRMNQYEQLGVLSQNIDNTFVGAGGYGYTNEITEVDNVKTLNMWGASAAQIFTSISSWMFEEFAIDCELDWLNRFALTYYGCCESLSEKIPILKKIKNLRKISVSAWADPNRAAEQIGKDYVYSYKPDPALLATETLDEDEVKKQIQIAVDATRKFGCSMEILLKTLTTVSYNPQKLWRWAKITQQIIESV